MKAVRLMSMVLGLTMVCAVAAEAAPITFTLQQTTVLYNEDPSGAPLPLGRIQRDAGNVIYNGQKIGEYLSIKDVHAAGMNTAAVTLTLFFPNPAGGPPYTLTLQGSHDFSSGKGLGSVSGSAYPGLLGVLYTTNTVTDTVTFYIP